MKISCVADGNKVALVLYDNNDKVLTKSECEKNFFCENITKMFGEIFNVLQKQNYDTDNIKYSVDFDTSKNITTARIFESFICGLSLKKQ